MTHHKKYSKCKCGCEKKTSKCKCGYEKKYCKCEKKHCEPKKCGCNCPCKCEQKYYFPLPNIPSQPVGGETVKPLSWFAPGSVQACCAICPTVQPVYANPCNTCRYEKGTHLINNTAYFTTNQYVN